MILTVKTTIATTMNRTVLATGGVLAASSGLFIALARRAQVGSRVDPRQLAPAPLQTVRQETAEGIRVREFEQYHAEEMKELWRAEVAKLKSTVKEYETEKYGKIAIWHNRLTDKDDYPRNFWRRGDKTTTNIAAFKAHIKNFTKDELEQ